MSDRSGLDDIVRVRDIVDRYVRRIDLGPVGRDKSHDSLELEFILVAKSFSHHYGISHETWIDVGVPCTVLEQAGLPV